MKKRGISIKWLLLAVICCLGMVNIANGAGTLTPTGSGVSPVAIKSHDVKVTINNGFARTEVVQIFSNKNTRKIEAVYAFPVPESASMSEVSVMVGETVINGEVVDKKKADEIYGKEKAKGNKAGKAEKNGFQDFKFMVGNINPNEDVTIKFVYYQPLKIDTGVGRYQYPLEEGNTDEVQKSFWERNDKVEGKTTITMELKSAWPVADVRATGGTPFNVEDKCPQGTFKASYDLKTGLTKDFVFYYRLQDNLPGRLEVIPYRAAGAKEGTFMMVVTPGLDLKPLSNGADYVFVLDISGSMQGEKIRTLCNGVGKVLGKMSQNDRFKIVTFEHTAKDLTSGWVNASEANVRSWIEKVKAIQANGGTNLYAGISKALNNLDADRATSIILVTDAVTNVGVVKPESFHKLLKKYDVRIFGFLMGNSGNWPLMRSICNTTGGFYAGVSNSDDLLGKILQAKKKITHECLHDAEIKINRGSVALIQCLDQSEAVPSARSRRGCQIKGEHLVRYSAACPLIGDDAMSIGLGHIFQCDPVGSEARWQAGNSGVKTVLLGSQIQRARYRQRSSIRVATIGQCGLVHQTTAGTVDDAHAFFGLGEVFRRQDVAGAIGQRHVQGDEIGAGQQLVEFDLFDLHLFGFFFCHHDQAHQKGRRYWTYYP